METREILELVRSGAMSVEEAEGHFRRQPFEDMGFAKLDLHRKIRSGFPSRSNTYPYLLNKLYFSGGLWYY